ncbi:MAG TPA: hypothetical protein VKA51_05515, partial [Rubrobacteraceae bacterium]|nr:hypothetical protein [Rubrobacteraceae bacterium]
MELRHPTTFGAVAKALSFTRAASQLGYAQSIFWPDGSPIAHDQCWMALALRMDDGYDGHEIVIERPDGQRRTALAHANPIHDES